jgi:hypothetical protein
MKIFDWIKGYFDKVCSRFRKKKQEQEVRDRITKTKGTSREEIQTNLITPPQTYLSIPIPLQLRYRRVLTSYRLLHLPIKLERINYFCETN